MTLTVGFILLGAMVGLAVGFFLGRLTSPGKRSQRNPISAQRPGHLPADIEQRVQALVDSGHKIGALKELRDSTGLGLKDAKNIVDSMATSLQPVSNADALAKARDLIRSGKKTEALKLYRESSGLALKEAKEEIDKLEKEFG